MGKGDIFQSINDLAPEAIQKIVDRLEFRGKDSVFVRMRDAYFNRMDLSSCKRILDLGCGTGVIARALAERKDFKGEIVGVDFSGALIDAANNLSSEEGLTEHIEFRVGDSHALNDADDSYDAVVAHTLVSHVAEPASVIKEAARVVVSGGLIAIFDGDYASLTFGAGDSELNATLI
jgi:ubiquinone/menaquinone biosynthesis C-methylase UbiE